MAAEGGPPTLAAPAVRPIASRMGRRILAWAAAGAVVVGLVQGMLAWQHTQAEFEQAVQEVAQTHVPLLATGVADGDTARLRRQIDQLVEARKVTLARLTTSTGLTLEAGEPAGAGPSEVRRFELTQPGRPEVTLGELQIQADPRALYRELLYNAVPSLLGCALLTWLIAAQARRVLRDELEQPMRQLTGHVQALAPHTLARPMVLQRKAGHERDEIDVLAEGFTALQRQLNHHLQRGERDLERQLALMEELIDALPNPIFVKDAQLVYTACNRAYEEAFGIDRRELVGRTVLDLPYHSPGDRQRFQAEDAELLERGGRAREEVVYQYADGAERTVIRLRATLRLSDGTAGGMVGALIDISDRKRRERVEAYRRGMFERMAHGASLSELCDAVVLGLQGELQGSRCALLFVEGEGGEALNPADAAVLRCHAPAWPALQRALADPDIARGLVQALPAHRLAALPADLPAWAPIAEIAAADGLGACGFEPLTLASGRQAGGFLTWWPGEAAPDELDTYLLESASRFTAMAVERAAAARALERKQVQLQESQRQLKLTIDTMQDGFIRGRNDDATDRVNNALVRMLGYASRLEMLGRPTKDFYARREDWETLVREVMARGFVRGMRCQAQRKDGSTFWADISAHPARDAEGRISGVEGVVRDISAQMAAEQALQLARDEARAASEAKGVFLANMSHEIRTPMNAVIGLTELTLRTELTAQQRGYLGKARAAAGALLEMLNDLLDLTKIESGRLDLESIVFDLSDVLDGAVLMVAAPVEEKGLALRIERGDGVPSRLVGDPLRVRQVLINLISNSCKFSERGQIVVRAERLPDPPAPGSWLRFTVTDPGIGMSPPQLERLFQPFVQADGSTTRRFGGTGLGLAISQQLVRLMGGDIRASSRLGEGSTFTVDLPLPDAGEGGVGADGASGPLQAVREVTARDLSRLRGARVLLVEDNAINRHVARELLHQAGLLVDVAEDGAQALQRLGEAPTPYDCVLMDLQMPGMDGYTATRRLRENPRWAALPVLAVTASVTAQDRQRVLEAGMNGHIAKPVLPADLYSALVRWIRPQQQDSDPPAPAPQAAGLTSAAGGPPVQGELPAALPGLDLDKALASTGGRPALLRRLLVDFLRDHEGDAQRVAQALDSGRTEDARRVAHTLRSVAGSLGARSLQEAAAALDLALRQDGGVRDEVALRTQGAALADALEEVMQGLRSATVAVAAAEPAAPLEISRRLDEIEALLREMDPEAVSRVEALLAAMPSAPPAAWQLAVDSAAFDFEAARSTLASLRHQLMSEAP